MRNRNVRRKTSFSSASRNITPVPWSYFAVLAICGCLLAAGFFLAARQHFSSMDYGINNSRLREQLKALETENRRLLLAREVSLSPFEIKKTARNLGFKEVNADLVTVQDAIVESPKNGKLSKTAVQNSGKVRDYVPPVKMITYQKPAKTPNTVPAHIGAEKKSAKSESGKSSRVKTEMTAVAKLR